MRRPCEFLLPEWPAPAGIRALATTRIGGFSAGPYAELNLGTHVGDDAGTVQRNREVLCHDARLPAMPVWLEQMHGTVVADLDHLPAGAPPPRADAAIASLPDRLCTVMTADCLPLLFCSRDGRRIAAAHAGWRGLCDGVIEATLAALCRPPGGPAVADVLVWLGPAIGPSAFEVGPEVRAAFLDRHAGDADCFRPGQGDRWLGDLFALARRRLNRAGVTAIYGGGLCTVSDPGRFFSHRRDGVSGRMATLIWRQAV